MIKSIGVGIGVFGSLVGALFAGMQLEQRLSSGAIQEAEEAGYRKGITDAESRYSAVEGPMSEFAKTLSSIFLSKEAKQVLPSDFIDQLAGSFEAAQSGDLDEAIRRLPEGIELLPIPDCVPTGRNAVLAVNSYIIDCQTGLRIGHAGRNALHLYFTLNGSDKLRVERAHAVSLGDTGCQFNALRFLDEKAVEVTVSC